MNARALVMLMLSACSAASHEASDAAVDEASDAGILAQLDKREMFIHRMYGGCDAGVDDEPPQTDPLPLEARADWLAATSFEIELQHTACYGFCPPYDVHIDQDGHVVIHTADFAPHPGVYAFTISAQQARDLFELMIDRGFLQLQGRFWNAADGCGQTYTDDLTTTFTLRAAGRIKPVSFYLGCKGSAADNVLPELDQRINEVSNATLLVEPAQSPRVQLVIDFAPSYVLQDSAHQNIGLLQVTLGRCGAPTTWSVHTCDGSELANGTKSNSSRPILSGNDPFTWPGAGDNRSAVVQTVTSPNEVFAEATESLTMHVLTLDDEIIQIATPGDTCVLAGAP